MRKVVFFALLAAAACGEATSSTPGPRDRFYYPTGLALTKLANGDTALLVASSNFDLQYDTATGGTVIAVDVEATIAQNKPTATGTLVPVIPAGARGAVSVGSFSGELALVNDATCPGWTANGGGAPLALVASRAQQTLYRISLDGNGGLTCGDGCALPLDPASADPYGVAIACGSFPPVAGTAPLPQAYAFTTYLRTLNAEGRVTQVDLLHAGVPPALVDLQLSPSASVAYDPVSTRVYVTSRFGTNGFAPLRWLQLAAPGVGATFFDVGTLVRGLEMRQLRLSSTTPLRGYLAMRLYDEDLATTIGGRPPSDLSGALGILDLGEQPSGAPAIGLVNTVGVGKGANEVQVIPRAGLRDLVVVSSTDDDSVSLYDDETGNVVKVFTVCGASDETAKPPPPCPSGKPELGKQPFGLAAEPFTRADIPGVPLARLYVGSFDRGWVNVIEIDPAHPAARTVGGVALRWVRIGAERP